MFGIKIPARKGNRDEGEKPFWISFSDLMTALMVLFLVALTVALLAITHEISEAEKNKVRRDEEIADLLQKISAVTENFPGVVVRGHSIDFGDRARYETSQHKLTKEQASLLRALVPRILEIARDPLGQKWLKRVIVEGFADQRGTYLSNLNLSLQRSQRVMCVLLAAPQQVSDALGEADRLLAVCRS